jgi:hypothetical protein
MKRRSVITLRFDPDCFIALFINIHYDQKKLSGVLWESSSLPPQQKVYRNM